MSKIRFSVLIVSWVMLFMIGGISLCPPRCSVPLFFAMTGVSLLMIAKASGTAWYHWVLSICALIISLKLILTGFTSEDPAKRAKDRILKQLEINKTNSVNGAKGQP